ncbi:MAG: AI-2E family transporter [Candidatus Cloacimonadales bacterium]|nr:AI-2E family transporter [Candidatus Cloacimonadales bacterium]
MNNTSQSSTRSKTVRWIIIIINLLLAVVSILFYKSILSYIFASFIIAYLIAPIINYVERYHISRAISILAVYVIIGFLLFLLFNAILPQMIQQYDAIQETIVNASKEGFSLSSLGLTKLDNYITNLETKFPNFEIREQVNSIFSTDKINKALSQIPQIFKGVFNLLAFLIVVPVVSFFLLKDERVFMRTIFSTIGNRYFEFSIHLFEKIEESFGKFFRALLLESFLVALMSVIGLLILGIPYALILGIVVGVANPIKYLGPFIGAVPTVLVILFGPVPDIYLLYITIMYFIVQQIDSLILFPWLIGKSMDMHPLLVILTVIAGGYAFGILGMLFGVPVVFLLKTIVEVSQKSLKEFEII